MNQEHKNLPLIREKIASIRSALFSNGGSGELKYNTCIISALKVDDDGSIWFLINRNGWRGFSDDLGFPASLSFYRKGISHSLFISGRAEIISNENIIRHTLTADDDEKQLDIEELLLVKLSIGHSVMFDWTTAEKKVSWATRIISFIKKLPYFDSETALAYKAI
jgi:hypothetical protein